MGTLFQRQSLMLQYKSDKQANFSRARAAQIFTLYMHDTHKSYPSTQRWVSLQKSGSLYIYLPTKLIKLEHSRSLSLQILTRV